VQRTGKRAAHEVTDSKLVENIDYKTGNLEWFARDHLVAFTFRIPTSIGNVIADRSIGDTLAIKETDFV